MEYRKKCNVCGKIFCYTDKDVYSGEPILLAFLANVLFRIMRFLSKSRRIAVVILAIIVSPFCACGWFKMLCVLRGWHGHF